MSVDKNDRISHHLMVLGGALQLANSTFEMLLLEMETPAKGNEDPAECEHPNVVDALGQRLCHDCGTNLDA